MLRSDIRRVPLRASIPENPHHPDAIREVRELLAALAEIDHAYRADLETVRTSDAPVAIKQRVTGALTRHHGEHRAPYLRRLLELRARSG